MRREGLTLISPTIEMLDAAIAESPALGHLLEAEIAEDFAVFPEALHGARTFLATDPAWKRWGTLFLLLNEPRTLVGIGGYKGAPKADGSVEIGYAISPEFRGRGLATTAAKEMVRRAFLDPTVEAVVAHTLAERNASTHVLENAGLRWVGEFDDPEDGRVYRFCITRAEYA